MVGFLSNNSKVLSCADIIGTASLRGLQVTKIGRLLILLTACGMAIQACRAEVHVVVDQVGYEIASQKQALVVGAEGDHPQSFHWSTLIAARQW